MAQAIRLNMVAAALLVAVLAFMVAPQAAEAREGRVVSGRFLKGDPKKGMHGKNPKTGKPYGMHKNRQRSGNGRVVGRHCNTNASICTDPKQYSFSKEDQPKCCARVCVNLNTDPLHCGKCFNPVAADLKCCGGNPVNLMTNNLNCGKCGRKCNKLTCVNGLCDY